MSSRVPFRFSLLASFFIVGLLGPDTSPCFAQSHVERVEPASLARGEVTRVTIHGRHLRYATGLWASTPGDRVQATRVGVSEPGRAVFDVKVAKGTPLGFYGLRLATESGLSNAHIFLIDEIATVPEEEMLVPKGTSPMQAPQVVELPVAIDGTCTAEDVDLFAFDAKAGQEVTFEVVGSRLGKGIDPLVTIRDADGRVIIEKDNDVGLFFDLRFAHRFPTAGRYTVEVRDSRFRGSEHWGYVLRMGRFPAARVAMPATVAAGVTTTLAFPQLGPLTKPELGRVTPGEEVVAGSLMFALKRPGDDLSAWLPLRVSRLPGTIETEPNDEPKQARAAAIPGVLHGVLGKPGDQDHFRVTLKKGQLYQLAAETHTIGSPADVELVLLDAAGKEVSRADDSGRDEARMNISPPADGDYTLVVRELVNWGGPEFAYAIRFQPRPPSLSLSSGVTRIALPQGTRQPLPLSLGQTAVKGDVSLKLLGAPQGVTIKITEVKGAGEIDNYLFCDASTPAGFYTLQVQAVLKSNPQITTLASTRPLVDRLPTGRGPHGEPFELREDQRRLPPSLTERIALLVLPAFPFDFDVAQPLVTLPRYQTTTFQVKATRAAGFDSPIRFAARGGELEQDRLRKPRVSSRFDEATVERPVVTGKFQSYVNTKLHRQRVTLTGTAVRDGRELSLTRTFDLEIVVAFRPGPVRKQVSLVAGSTVAVKLRPNRLAPFDGPVTLSIGQVKGLEMPGTVIVPEGAEEIEIDVKVAADLKPGTYKVSLSGIARVERFQESAGGEGFEVVVTAAKK